MELLCTLRGRHQRAPLLHILYICRGSACTGFPCSTSQLLRKPPNISSSAVPMHCLDRFIMPLFAFVSRCGPAHLLWLIYFQHVTVLFVFLPYVSPKCNYFFSHSLRPSASLFCFHLLVAITSRAQKCQNVFVSKDKDTLSLHHFELLQSTTPSHGSD